MERRAFVIGSVGSALGFAAPAAAQRLVRTPGQILGPFYPVLKPGDADVDLTHVAGRPGTALGDRITVMGRVMTEAREPVPAAEIEIWQTDAAGHYTHPTDRSSGSVDPNFQGYAAFKVAADGRFQFMTVKPGAYADDGAGGMRAPHIHFQVTGRINRLITQMYFEGEPLNATDRVLAFAGANGRRLISAFDPAVRAPGARAAVWTIVLRDG